MTLYFVFHLFLAYDSLYLISDSPGSYHIIDSYCHIIPYSMMSLHTCTYLFLVHLQQYISQAFWVPKAPDLTSPVIQYLSIDLLPEGTPSLMFSTRDILHKDFVSQKVSLITRSFRVALLQLLFRTQNQNPQCHIPNRQYYPKSRERPYRDVTCYQRI